MTPAALVRSAAASVGLASAEYLLSHILCLKKHEIYQDSSAVSDRNVADFLASVDEALSGRPVQYVVGSAPFLDFSVYVDERVFIPRPETEQLVARACEMIGDPELVVDYGTGSGCMAIAIARRFPRTRIVAVDASRDALDVAGRNAATFGTEDRIELVHAAALTDAFFELLLDSVGLLISNPPYIPSARIPELDTRVRDHEPILGLDGGPNGASILKMIVDEGLRLLVPGGLLALEIDSTQAEMMREAVPGSVIEPDLTDRPRYLFHRRSVTA